MVKEIDGLKIGFFGLGIELNGLVEKRHFGETNYLDPIKTTHYWSEYLKYEERCNLERDNSQRRDLTSQQDEVIGESEGRISQMVDALEKAAEAGLTSVTADEVRSLKSQLDSMSKQFEVEQAANKALEEERQRLRDIADRLRGLLDARDGRLGELAEQLERVMQGPRSVSAEPDYLVEQIAELKRRLLERNR